MTVQVLIWDIVIFPHYYLSLCKLSEKTWLFFVGQNFYQFSVNHCVATAFNQYLAFPKIKRKFSYLSKKVWNNPNVHSVLEFDNFTEAVKITKNHAHNGLKMIFKCISKTYQLHKKLFKYINNFSWSLTGKTSKIS